MKKPLFVGLLCVILSLSKGLQAQLRFHWRQYSGPVTGHIQNADTSTTEVTGLMQVGIYGFELTVSLYATDSIGMPITISGKDSMTVTVIAGTLGIESDSVYHIERPKITKLEIKTAVYGDNIYVIIKSPKSQKIDCAIYDIAGRKLAKAEILVHRGDNFATLPKPRLSGIYILRFLTYFDSQTKKIFF